MLEDAHSEVERTQCSGEVGGPRRGGGGGRGRGDTDKCTHRAKQSERLSYGVRGTDTRAGRSGCVFLTFLSPAHCERLEQLKSQSVFKD